MVFGLKGVVEGDDEGMITRCENFLFCEGSFDFISFYHFFLAQYYISHFFPEDKYLSWRTVDAISFPVRDIPCLHLPSPIILFSQS